MGANLNPAGGRHRPGRTRHMAEINVTPMVDVMLVLLIVFMVAAPLLTVGIPVDTPETAANPLQDTGEPITVSVTADGTIYVQETPVEYENLTAHLEAIATAGYDQRILIRGDKTRAFGDIARVMGRINAAGFRQIGLVTDQEK